MIKNACANIFNLIHLKYMSLELKNIQKKYGDQLVLDIAELTILPGKFAAIIGPSGSAKSTFFEYIERSR